MTEKVRDKAAGFSLVELIVVIAILAVVAAVAIPGFARLGAFSRDDAGGAARDLYNMLRAARVYASTYRVDTAVVYGLRDFDPNRVPADSRQIGVDSYSFARRIGDAEAAELGITDANKKLYTFVVVKDFTGTFRTFDGFAAAFQSVTDNSTRKPDGSLEVASGLTYMDGSKGGVAAERLGLSYIRLITLERDSVTNTLTATDLTPRSELGVASSDAPFPAHRFTPAGVLRGGATKTRLTLHVAMSPEADPAERFMPDDEGNPDENRPLYYPVYLHAQTGRVEIGAKEELP